MEFNIKSKEEIYSIIHAFGMMCYKEAIKNKRISEITLEDITNIMKKNLDEANYVLFLNDDLDYNEMDLYLEHDWGIKINE